MSHSMAITSRNKRKARSSPERETQPPSPNADPNIPSSSSSVADNFSSPSMQPLVFPPGYKFTPSDEELILYYLKPLSQGNRYVLLNVPIHHVNIYEYNPQQLTEKFEKANEKEWIFITEWTKMRKGGKNNKRCINGGYWKKTVTPEKINAGHGVVGYMSLLNYFSGKRPNGVKGDWLMQEYYFESSSHNNDKVDYSLCKIYLNPTAEKKKKKAEKEKLKKEECIEIIDVEALEKEVELPSKVEYQQPQMQQQHDIVYQQPQMQQQHDIVYQQPQYPLPSAQDQSFPSNFDYFSEIMSFQQPPEISEDFDDILNNFINSHSLGGDEESNPYGLFGDFIKQGMKKPCTT
ncbi:NAC domain-containing protein 2 [Cardamine amara subsp. amara]|uniref:NAC domain-containing protein 2 n=1 Tax=Cardamine amara subsp. amara TaxID=228776 RepID=A0ABD0ZXZ8_CARAN